MTHDHRAPSRLQPRRFGLCENIKPDADYASRSSINSLQRFLPAPIRHRVGNKRPTLVVAAPDATMQSGIMALHADVFRARTAECFALAQNADDSTVKQAYLELMQGWRVLADEVDRLTSKPPIGMSPLIAAGPTKRYFKTNLPSRA